MRLQALAVMLFIFLHGCAFHSEPKDNQEFYQISQMSELAGVYKNKGDPWGYLSKFIWGYTKLNINPEVSHEDIELIEVLSTENSLILKAIKSGCAIYEKSYILGRDFKISGGKIIMRSIGWADEPTAGPSYEHIALGLDVGKHGKYRKSEYVAGLVFMLIPVAFSSTQDIRFERANDRPQGFEACSNR